MEDKNYEIFHSLYQGIGLLLHDVVFQRGIAQHLVVKCNGLLFSLVIFLSVILVYLVDLIFIRLFILCIYKMFLERRSHQLIGRIFLFPLSDLGNWGSSKVLVSILTFV